MNDAPIGIFDSGVGGLTVARAVSAQLPRESILYIGDTARSPYGPKPIADVRRYALEILDTLVEQGVKMLVIACNTASAAMLRDARERKTGLVPLLQIPTAFSLPRADVRRLEDAGRDALRASPRFQQLKAALRAETADGGHAERAAAAE